MWRGPLGYIAKDFLLTSPAVFHILVCLWYLSWWKVGSCIAAVLWGVATRTRSILLVAFWCNCRQVFSPCVYLESMVCINIAVSTRSRFILSVRSDFHMTDSLLIVVQVFGSQVLIYIYIYIYIWMRDTQERYTCNYKFIYLLINLFTQHFLPKVGWNMRRSCLWKIWIQSFPSSRLVASPKLKKPLCTTVYALLWSWRKRCIQNFFFREYSR